MATKQQPVPTEIVAKLQLTCLDLPEAYEEQAWVGTRWMVAKQNFAHVLMIARGAPAHYAKVARTQGPACVLTFRTPTPKNPRFHQPPFFLPGWWPDIVGMFLDDATDWDEVAALVTASYKKLAPKKLAELVEDPG